MKRTPPENEVEFGCELTTSHYRVARAQAPLQLYGKFGLADLRTAPRTAAISVRGSGRWSWSRPIRSVFLRCSAAARRAAVARRQNPLPARRGVRGRLQSDSEACAASYVDSLRRSGGQFSLGWPTLERKTILQSAEGADRFPKIRLSRRGPFCRPRPSCPAIAANDKRPIEWPAYSRAESNPGQSNGPIAAQAGVSLQNCGGPRERRRFGPRYRPTGPVRKEGTREDDCSEILEFLLCNDGTKTFLRPRPA